MTGYFSTDGSAEVVAGRTGAAASPRVAEVVASLVEHLHAFVKDVQLTQEEWQRAVEFLTATGRTCTEERQEFVLLSDVLGISMLVDAVAHPRRPGATESTVLGPFHVEGAPQRAMGDDICLDGLGESCLFEGRVLDLDGAPVAGACLDVWSDNAEGYYDVQQPDVQPRWNNRGRFTTGPDGRYAFRGIKPTAYPIPDDGPVGHLLTALDRSPYRPAHLHLIVTAPGFRPLVTHTFVDGDEHLASDAVFGVKESLVAAYTPTPDGATTWRCAFDVVLAPTRSTPSRPTP